MTELEQKKLAIRERTAETKKVAVVLHDEEADELGALGSLFLRKGALGSYIYAKTVDPNGPYFHMLIEHKNVFDGSVVEFELQLPHSCIKAVFYAADVTRLGFV